jgi:hypothetical protein
LAAADIANGAGKAVKFNADGKIVVCSTAGEAILGFIIMQANGDIKAGDSVTVQTCCKGMAIAGGTIAAGDLLSVDANGTVVKATDGYIVGQAMGAGVAGGIVNIEIIKGGKA